jgi:hypothetical protein
MCVPELDSFVTCEDLSDILGNSTEYEALQKIWQDTLEECKSHMDRITFEDFKNLMKGQPKDSLVNTGDASCSQLPGVPEDQDMPSLVSDSIFSESTISTHELPDSTGHVVKGHRKRRSSSFDHIVWTTSSLAIKLGHDSASSMSSSIAANRTVYRAHREMRLAVLAASKQFDKKRTDIQTNPRHTRASLIMKRGSMALVKAQDADSRALFEEAAARSGRERRQRNKTVSDVTGMLSKATSEQ